MSDNDKMAEAARAATCGYCRSGRHLSGAIHEVHRYEGTHFIECKTPPAVLALIDRLKAAEAERDRVRGWYEEAAQVVGVVTAERDRYQHTLSVVATGVLGQLVLFRMKPCFIQDACHAGGERAAYEYNDHVARLEEIARIAQAVLPSAKAMEGGD